MGTTFDYSPYPPTDAADLRHIAGQVRELVQRATPLLIEIGDYLNSAKKKLAHGQFQIFCEAEAGVEFRSAQNYMSLATLARSYPRAEVEQLPARAGYKLAEKATPARIVAEVMSEVRAGRVPTLNEVKSRVAAAKGLTEPAKIVDIDKLANRLLDSLDPGDVGDIVLLLKKGTKAIMALLCERLEQGLKQPRTGEAVAEVLPPNQLHI